MVMIAHVVLPRSVSTDELIEARCVWGKQVCAMNGCQVDSHYRAQYARKIIHKQIALFHQPTVVEFFKLIYKKNKLWRSVVFQTLQAVQAIQIIHYASDWSEKWKPLHSSGALTTLTTCSSLPEKKQKTPNSVWFHVFNPNAALMLATFQLFHFPLHIGTS